MVITQNILWLLMILFKIEVDISLTPCNFKQFVSLKTDNSLGLIIIVEPVTAGYQYLNIALLLTVCLLLSQ